MRTLTIPVWCLAVLFAVALSCGPKPASGTGPMGPNEPGGQPGKASGGEGQVGRDSQKEGKAKELSLTSKKTESMDYRLEAGEAKVVAFATLPEGKRIEILAES